MNKRVFFFLMVICVCLFCTACIKDTNFDQTEDIALTPVIELDLIYFNLKAGDFFDTITSNPVLTLRDTTKINFLNNSGHQESLKRAEFYFKFTNSIPRTFQVVFQFLNELNNTTYTMQTPVVQGTLSNPMLTEFTQNVEGDDILRLTQADKVVVSVTIPSSDENLEGILNLKSKTTYFLKY